LVFEELRRREAAHAAILYAFDVIEHNGADPRDRGFLDRKAALVLPIPRRLLNDCRGLALFVSRLACPVWIKVRNRASVAPQRERNEDWNK
jgi:hypothetical protein